MKFIYKLTAVGFISAVIAFQMAYLFADYQIRPVSYEYFPYIAGAIITLGFIVGLILLYKYKTCEDRRSTFFGKKLLTVEQYEKMIKIKTPHEVEKLRKSQAYKEYEIDKKFRKSGKSNSKTAATQRHQDEFEDLWLSQ